MNNNIVETILGAAVLLIAGFFVLYAYSVAGVSSQSGYILTANFNRVDGLVLGADIRLSGIKIGSVTKMDLDKESYQAIVEMTIDSDIRLYEGTAAKITSAGIFGSQYISLDPGGGEESLEEGDEIVDAVGAVDLVQLISKFIFSDTDSESSQK